MRQPFMTTLILALLFFWESPAWSMTDAEAINKSGRQRMLSQRMMKDYLMIGSGILPGKAQQELDASVALFEQQLLELREYAPTANIHAALDDVEKLWIPFRRLIISKPDRQQAAQMLTANDELLKACHKVVGLIQDYSGAEAAHQINLSGRQRMLSQRIAKFYLAQYWRLSHAMTKAELQSAMDQFEQALNELSSYSYNSQEIKQKLSKVRSQWDFSKAGFRAQQEGRYVPTVIYITTESILKKMNDITGDYEQLMQTLNAKVQTH